MEKHQKTDSNKSSTKRNVTKAVSPAYEGKVPWGFITTALTAIPILGAIGFLVAFLHEVGYTSVYQFPIELIRLDSVTILKYVALTLLLLFAFGVTGVVLAAIVNNNSRGIYVFLGYANFIIIPVLIYASFKNYFGGSSPYISLGILVFQSLLLVPLNWKNGDDVNLQQKIKAITKYWPAFTVTILIILCILAYISGTMDASFQRTYLSPSTNPDSVVLRIYGDNVICATLADNTTIKRSYFVLKLNEPDLVLSAREFPNRLFVETK